MSPARIESLLRRGLLMAALVGGFQAAILGLGWLIVYQYTHERVAQSVEDVIVTANVAAAETVVDSLGGTLQVGEFGSPEWERAQRIVEELELGGGGFACILDRDGKVLCHPEIRETPEMRSVDLGQQQLHPLKGGASSRLMELDGEEIATGVLEHPILGKHYIATRQGEGGAQLLVHQPVSGLEAASRQVTGGLLLRTLVVGGLVVALTGLLGMLLIRTHDRALLRWNRDLERVVHERSEELVRTHRGILFGIAKLSEYRDNETGMHVERMCAYSKTLARELQRRGAPVDDQWVDDIALAASLHDIGKVAIPDAILLKPGKLTDSEFETMKEHVSVGEEALHAVHKEVGASRLLDMGIEIAGGHHERWDGNGYPRGVSGSDIPLSARIVAVADVFDALMSKRVYKEAMPFDQVKKIIDEGSGKHFDPQVVEAFHAVSKALLEIRRRMQDEPEVEPEVPGLFVFDQPEASTSISTRVSSTLA